MFGACVGYLEVLEDVFNGFEFTSNSTLHTKWGKTGLNKEMADIIAAGAAILCFGLSTLRDISPSSTRQRRRCSPSYSR